jgi:hypothetical protein
MNRIWGCKSIYCASSNVITSLFALHWVNCWSQLTSLFHTKSKDKLISPSWGCCAINFKTVIQVKHLAYYRSLFFKLECSHTSPELLKHTFWINKCGIECSFLTGTLMRPVLVFYVSPFSRKYLGYLEFICTHIFIIIVILLLLTPNFPANCNFIIKRNISTV